MKGNLALLDRAVQGAIAHELGDGEHDPIALAELGVAPARMRSVAGLRVISNAARDAEFDKNAAKLHDGLLRYRADRQLVVEKLKRVGVEPLAVLPLTAWERICDATKLFRFTPSGNTVRCDTRVLHQEAQAELAKLPVSTGLKIFWSLCLLALLAGVTLVTRSNLAEYGNAFDKWAIFPYFAVSMVMFLVWGAGSAIAVTESDNSQQSAAAMATVLGRHTEDGTLLELLWPNYREPDQGDAVAISLPDAPSDVQEKLVALERARLTMRIAVVKEAIGVDGKLQGAIIGKFVEAMEALKRDPIVFVREGTAVAIIAQFGDFPIEKEVIEKVINSEHLV